MVYEIIWWILKVGWEKCILIINYGHLVKPNDTRGGLWGGRGADSGGHHPSKRPTENEAGPVTRRQLSLHVGAERCQLWALGGSGMRTGEDITDTLKNVSARLRAVARLVWPDRLQAWNIPVQKSALSVDEI